MEEKLDTLGKREKRLIILKRLREALNKTDRLKTAFSDDYFRELECVIDAAGDADLFEAPKHLFFITFMDLNDVVSELEETFVFVEKTFNRTLTTEIKKLAGSHTDVVSTVFQFMVLSKFVKRGLIKAYEPKTGSGSRPEAIVNLAGQDVLVEAQSKVDEDLPSSLDDEKARVKKLHGKLMEKCSAGQLANAKLPGVLFQNTDFGVWGHHVEKVLAIANDDPNCRSASAIVFGWTHTGGKWSVWINPNASDPLSSAAEQQLRDLFEK